MALTRIYGNLISSATITGASIAANSIGSSNLTITGVASGTYGGSTQIPVITVDSQGRVSAAANVSGGGATLSNDTTTASNLFPIFAASISGLASTVYTSNTKLLYKPSTGDFQSSQFVAGNGLIINNQTINTSYSVPATQSAMSTGPITLANTVSITLASGARWVVL